MSCKRKLEVNKPPPTCLHLFLKSLLCFFHIGRLHLTTELDYCFSNAKLDSRTSLVCSQSQCSLTPALLESYHCRFYFLDELCKMWITLPLMNDKEVCLLRDSLHFESQFGRCHRKAATCRQTRLCFVVCLRLLYWAVGQQRNNASRQSGSLPCATLGAR